MYAAPDPFAETPHIPLIYPQNQGLRYFFSPPHKLHRSWKKLFFFFRKLLSAVLNIAGIFVITDGSKIVPGKLRYFRCGSFLQSVIFFKMGRIRSLFVCRLKYCLMKFCPTGAGFDRKQNEMFQN